MKRNILIFSLMVFLFSISANAQLTVFTPFKVKSGLTFATSEAKKTLANPVLRGIGSVSMELDGGISLNINVDNGTATTWLFVFQDGDDAEMTASIPVINLPILGYRNALNFGVDASIIDGFLVFLPNTPFPTSNWLDSDLMCEKLRDNNIYKNIKSENDTLSPFSLGLGINEFNPLVTIGEMYWSIVFDPESGTSCYVHAETGETTCFVFSSIEDANSIFAFDVFPNPTSEILNITLDENLSQELLSYDIIDGTGNLIKSFENNSTNSISINELPIGNYFLRYNGSQIKLAKQFTVIR